MSRRYIPPTVDAFRPAVISGGDDEASRSRDAGFAEGHASGVREGRLAGIREGEARCREEMQAELSAMREKFAKQDARQRIADTLEALLATREQQDRAIEDAARDAVATALRTLFPTLMTHVAGEEVVAVVQEALNVRSPDALTLRAHPDTLAIVAEKKLPATAGGRLVLMPDIGLAHGNAVVTWAGGGLTFDPPALLERVVALFTPETPMEEEVAA